MHGNYLALFRIFCLAVILVILRSAKGGTGSGCPSKYRIRLIIKRLSLKPSSIISGESNNTLLYFWLPQVKSNLKFPKINKSGNL